MPKEIIHDYGEPERITEVVWVRDAWVQLGTMNTETEPRSGQFMQLDRHGINRLIRALRRARDSAFGKDA